MLKGLGWHASPLHPSQTPARFKRLFIASAATTSQLRRPCAVACRPGFQSGRPARTYQRSLSWVVKNRCVADSRTQGRGPNLNNKKQKKHISATLGLGPQSPGLLKYCFFWFLWFFRFGLHPCVWTCAMLPKTDMHNMFWMCNQMLAHVQNRPCRQWPQCKEALYEKWVFGWGEMLHFIKHGVSPRRERTFSWHVSKKVCPHSGRFCIYIYI